MVLIGLMGPGPWKSDGGPKKKSGLLQLRISILMIFWKNLIFRYIFRCIFDIFWCWDGPWYSPDGPGDPWDQKKSKKTFKDF